MFNSSFKSLYSIYLCLKPLNTICLMRSVCHWGWQYFIQLPDLDTFSCIALDMFLFLAVHIIITLFHKTSFSAALGCVARFC